MSKESRTFLFADKYPLLLRSARFSLDKKSGKRKAAGLCFSRMKILKAFKTELDPNNKQKTLFGRYCGASRFVFNWGLAEWGFGVYPTHMWRFGLNTIK